MGRRYKKKVSIYLAPKDYEEFESCIKSIGNPKSQTIVKLIKGWVKIYKRFQFLKKYNLNRMSFSIEINYEKEKFDSEGLEKIELLIDSISEFLKNITVGVKLNLEDEDIAPQYDKKINEENAKEIAKKFKIIKELIEEKKD